MININNKKNLITTNIHYHLACVTSLTT